MNRKNLFNTLQLKNNSIIYQNVNSIDTLKKLFFIRYRQNFLLFKRNTHLCQLIT